MLKRAQKFNALTQNIILGSITGIMVGVNLRLVYMRLGGIDIIWVAFFLLGPTVGYLSGKERQRVEKLKQEKIQLTEDIENVQSALQKSTKKYRLLVEQANDAIFLTSIDGRFLLFNEATCRYAGCTKSQLKNMNIKSLRGGDEKHIEEAWMDNGVYRYDDCWINSSKKEILLEINARWIQFGDHKVILHVGRDVKQQKETGKKDFVKQIGLIQESSLVTMAKLHDNLLKQNLVPVFDGIGVLQGLQAKYPDEAKTIQGVVDTLQNARTAIIDFFGKNDRDMDNIPKPWVMNEVLQQELVHLDTISDSKNFKVKTAFTANLAAVNGVGRDFSIAFSTLFQGMKACMTHLKQQGLYISTRSLDNSIFIEVIAPGRDELYQQICYCMDPIYREFGDTSEHKELGKKLLKAFFKKFDAEVDGGYQDGKGIVVRIRIPVVSKMKQMDPPRAKVTELQKDVIL